MFPRANPTPSPAPREAVLIPDVHGQRAPETVATLDPRSPFLPPHSSPGETDPGRPSRRGSSGRRAPKPWDAPAPLPQFPGRPCAGRCDHLRAQGPPGARGPSGAQEASGWLSRGAPHRTAHPKTGARKEQLKSQVQKNQEESSRALGVVWWRSH